MKRRLVVLCLVALLFLVAIQVVRAAEAPALTLGWWTVDSGGGSIHGGTFSINATVGQAEPGSLSGGSYSLVGGFWADLQAALEKIFLPLVRKN
jgi:hypothetical protein